MGQVFGLLGFLEFLSRILVADCGTEEPNILAFPVPRTRQPV